MELKDSCQCCLLRPLDKDLRKCYRRLDQKEVYSDMLEECFEIQLWSSGLEVDAGICEICVSRLRDACDFKRQVVRCQRKLQAAVKEEAEDDVKEEVVVVMVDSDIEFLDDDIKSESPDSPESCSDYSEDSKSESKPKTGIPRIAGVTVKRTLEKRTRSSVDESPRDEDVKRKPLSQEKSDLVKLLGLPKSDVTVRPTRAAGPKTRAQGVIAAKKPAPATQKPVPMRINLQADKKPVKVTPKPVPKPAPKSAEDVKVRKRKSAAALAAVRAHEANVRTLIQHSNCTPFLTRTIAGIQCGYCEANFLNVALLRDHMQSTHTFEKFLKMTTHGRRMDVHCKMDITDLECKLCDENFDLLSSLKEHLIEEHDVEFSPEEKDYILEFKLSDEGEVMKCVHCNSSFEAFKSLLQHMNRHYRNFLCKDCDAGFITQYKLFKHEKTHKIGTFSCTFCAKVFPTVVSQVYHENKIHKNAGRHVKCPLCKETFTSYKFRNRHILEDHNSTATSYKCNICDRVYTIKKELSEHVRKVHLMEKNHKCLYCGAAFFVKSDLSKHMIRHTGERIHKCTKCSKAYARRATLMEHMRKHNNDRRFKCELCGLAFLQKCSLKGHMVSHHGLTLAQFELAKQSPE